jgi:NADH-quinone oxidoreductase subunit A
MGNYLSLLTYFLTSVLVAVLVILLVLAVVKQRPVRKKLMSYECGFEPFNDARKPFYVNFYNIGLAFLLFDVEIMLLLPGVYGFGFMTEEGAF